MPLPKTTTSTLGQPLTAEFAGQTFWLLPERALWWPAGRMLLVADIHIGKAAAYRALGQPVPSGTTVENLQRLSQLLHHYQPAQLVFLGDFLHAASSRTPSVLQALQDWRADFASLACTLVRGNHDSRAGDPPAELGFAVVDEPWPLAGRGVGATADADAGNAIFACHHPQTVPGGLVLAGHVHPALTLRGNSRGDAMRLPCFCADAGLLVLPAFGEFTGGWTVQPQPGRERFAVGGGAVWRLPSL